MPKKKEREPITDGYVLSKEKLTSKEAAAYLGMSWWVLTDGLQKGEYPFGTAKLGNGGRWTYTIWAQCIYKFKHGEEIDLRKEARMLGDQIKELIGKMQDLEDLLKNAS